ncbi:MAG: ATP-binding cassette domain-containing protein, partial [Tissierellia bacterium]|nr:ATP-binding cassette domain-containing protein [Tissierellia bacterium]
MANEKKILIRVENLKQYFPVKKASFRQKEQLFVRANDDITLDIYQGETLGLVGESGCGKSTLGRTLLQLYNQTDGRTMYYGEDIDEVAPEYVLDILKNLSAKRKEVQAKQKKEIEFAKTYDKMTDGEEKRVALEEKQMLEKDARNSLLDITQLIGGFIVADDLAPISGILVKEYNASIELRILKDKLNEDMIELQAAMGLLQEKGKTEEQINEELKQQLKKVQDQEK